MGMQPDDQGIFFVLVVQGGPGSGEFIYDANGNLRSSNVGQATTDPIQGISCPQGFATYNGHGAVINLLSTSNGAFFQYLDHGTSVQGALILVVASTSGTDPVDGTNYVAGLTGIDPVFGDTINTVGATINFQVAGNFTQTARIQANKGSVSVPPYVVLYAPEQGVSGHLVMMMQGASPDGTVSPQFLISQEPTGFATPAIATPGSLVEIQAPAAAPANPILSLLAKATGDKTIGVRVSGDTVSRLAINSGGRIDWGSGAGAADTSVVRPTPNLLQVLTADLDIATAGRGLQISEGGAAARMGRAVLSGGTKVVANTSITAATEIFLTCQVPGGTPGFLRVSARTAGTSFTILSSSGTDTSTVAWLLIEPG